LNLPAIQLLVARWYPGSGISPEQAGAELKRRGWSRSKQLLALALLLPLIAPDRVMRRADAARDDFEESGTPRELVFSALFSVFLIGLAGTVVSLSLVASRHDSGQPYGWRWLMGWATIAGISGLAARAAARFRA
jgi:hypothetical protein